MSLTLTVHRETKEIGGNCIEIKHPQGERIVLDAGRPLDVPDGATGLLPTSLDRSCPATLLISHPHQDYWGLVEELRPRDPDHFGAAHVLANRRLVDACCLAHLTDPEPQLMRQPQHLTDFPHRHSHPRGKLLDQPFREGVPHNIGTDCRVSIDRAGRYIEAVSLFWLNYRHPDGRFTVVAVVEATALVQARMKAAVTELDHGLDFVVGHELSEESAQHIPTDMIGRLLDDGDLRRLERIITRKKPAAPSVRRRTAAKRSAAKQ